MDSLLAQLPPLLHSPPIYFPPFLTASLRLILALILLLNLVSLCTSLLLTFLSPRLLRRLLKNRSIQIPDGRQIAVEGLTCGSAFVVSVCGPQYLLWRANPWRRRDGTGTAFLHLRSPDVAVAVAVGPRPEGSGDDAGPEVGTAEVNNSGPSFDFFRDAMSREVRCRFSHRQERDGTRP